MTKPKTRAVLGGLVHAGELRMREPDPGVFRVKRPEGAVVQSVVVVDEKSFTWRCESTGTEGRGAFALARHLGITLEAVCAAL